MRTPDLSLVHLADLDSEEHETGALLSIYSRETLENDDELLGQMITHFHPHTLVAIVSGNGFETEEHVIRPRVMAASAAVEVRYGLIGATDLKAGGRAAQTSSSEEEWTLSRGPYGGIKAIRAGSYGLGGGVQCHFAVCGYVAVDGPTRDRPWAPGNHRGVHGLWPTRLNYRSDFVVSGDRVRPVVHLGEISVLDVAPTLATMLGVSLPEARQPSLWPKLKK